jgi:2-haloacid dehalogenase/putative hydrolase of the HAD superfamily
VIRALLLDFYGTVVAEDDPVVHGIGEAVAATATRPATAREVGTHWWAGFQADAAGYGPDFRTQRDIALRSLARTVSHFGSTADPEALCAPQFAYWRRPELYPDAAAFLAALDIPVCVVSNIDRADLSAALGHHGLSFPHVLTSEDVRAYKPRPELFHAALAQLGVEPSQALHVGDSLSADVAGAYRVGIPAVWVNRAARPVPDGFTARATVTSLPDVLPLLRGSWLA